MSKLLEQINTESKLYLISDLVDIKYGFGLPEPKRIKGSIPVYASSGIVGYHNEARVNTHSIIIGRKGNVGSLYFSEQPSFPIDTAFFIDEPKDGFDLKYIFYLLKRINLPRYGGDSAVPGLSRDTVYSLRVETPKLTTQKKIAEILSAYDAKIENNNKIIKNLEATAQAIFKKWFSKIGETPKGWEVKSLNDVADVIFGFNFKAKDFNEEKNGVPVVRIRDVLDGTTKTFTPEIPDDEYKINTGDLLIGMDGTFHCSFWYTDGAYLNQRVARIRSKLPGYFIFESVRLQLDFLQKTITGATVGHLANGDIRNFQIFVPKDVSILSIFENITKKVLSLRKEIMNLKESRDQLLAKLI